MLACYLGYSNIPEFKEKGHTGGIASTLGYYAVRKGFVDGVVVSKPFKTFIARTKADFLDSCGSIYEDFKYEKINDGGLLGQIGKPCDLSNSYHIKISIFCSHVTYPQTFKITPKNRAKISRSQTPLRCWFCLDHLGHNSDISVGDSQTHNDVNFILINSWKGKKIIESAINDKYVVCSGITYDALKERQPYLYIGLRGKILWAITKAKRFL